jgi:hypothetical protein
MNVIGQTDIFQSYSYNNLGISLEHPPDWQFASLKNGIQLVKEKNAAYVEIRKSNSQPSNTTLEQLALNAIQERFSSRKDFQVLNLSKTSISGNLPAYKAVYEFLKTPNENPPTNEGTTNKVLRITTFANGIAYIVKYVSEKNKYDLYLPIAEKIIHSLKFNVQENVKAKSDNNNNNINNNNNNHKTSSNNNNKLKECFSGKNGPPCILSDNTIAYNCNDDRHFKSPNEECVYWNKSTNGWDLRLKLSGNKDGGYACRFAEAKIVESNKDLPVCKEKKPDNKVGKILVSYGDVGGYQGKGKIVIKNQDTGQNLVTHDLNFAKLRASEGNDCCYKVYTFDSNKTHFGDKLTIKVTGGGGSWEDYGFYKKKTHLYVTLDEIGDDENGNYITSNNNGNNDNNKKSNNNNNNNDNKKDNGCPKSGFGSDADFCGDFGGSNDDSHNYGNDYNYNNDGNLTAYYNIPQIIGIT